MNRKIAALAYLAGVIDSDGTIGIKKNTYAVRVIKDSAQATYSERIHIRQVTREALDLLAKTFGGNVTTEHPSALRGKMLYKWGVTDLRAIEVLNALLPFLRIKKRQALNCLALRKLKNKSKIARLAKGRGHVGSAPRPKSLSDAMQLIYEKAKGLNHVGI